MNRVWKGKSQNLVKTKMKRKWAKVKVKERFGLKSWESKTKAKLTRRKRKRHHSQRTFWDAKKIWKWAGIKIRISQGRTWVAIWKTKKGIWGCRKGKNWSSHWEISVWVISEMRSKGQRFKQV